MTIRKTYWLIASAALLAAVQPLSAQHAPFRAPRLGAGFFPGTKVDYGLIVGNGSTVYGSQLGDPESDAGKTLRVAVGPGVQFLVDYSTPVGQLTQKLAMFVRGRISKLEGNRFFGFGNQTARIVPGKFSRLIRYEYLVEAAIVRAGRDGWYGFSFGPLFKLTNTRPALEVQELEAVGVDPLTLPALSLPYGHGRFGQVGFRADMRVGTRRSSSTSSGVALSVGGAAYPALLSVTTPFATLHAEGQGSISTALPLSPTLAVRAGVEKVLGTAPFHEAAVVGGTSTLRGFDYQRFAGDAAVFGGAELRLTVGESRLLSHPVRFGVMGLADVARVYYRGESPGGWHAAAGGGVWLKPTGSPTTLTAGLAQGAEGTRLFLQMGLGF